MNLSRKTISKHTRIAMLITAAFLAAGSLFGAQTPSAADELENHPDKPQAFPNIAQKLTDQEMQRHPDVVTVAFHAVIPGEPINRVIAINEAMRKKFQWRPSDDIDTQTAQNSKTIVQVIPATHRMEVHMPLHTKTGETIATFVCVWNFKDEEEAPELMRRSQKIRDEVAPDVVSVEQLLRKP